MKNKDKVTKTKKPLVSVILPVYNAEDFLVESIESVLNQTYQNFELIIINDSSTDNSLKIIKKYQKLNPEKIKVINLKQNLNCGGDRCANLGINIARGKYIARMDADDVCHPHRLEKQVEFLEKHKDIFLVGTNAYVIDKKGYLMGEKLEPQSNEDIKNSYFTFHPLIHPSCMIRTKTQNSNRSPRCTSRARLAKRVDAGEAGKSQKFIYEIKYSANNDYYTFFKLLCNGYKFANLPEKLLFFRIHGKNDTFVNMKEKYLNTLKARLIMVFKYGYKPDIKSILVATIQTMLVFTLPEKALTEIYFLAKGIKKPALPSIRIIPDVFGKLGLAIKQ